MPLLDRSHGRSTRLSLNVVRAALAGRAAGGFGGLRGRLQMRAQSLPDVIHTHAGQVGKSTWRAVTGRRACSLAVSALSRMTGNLCLEPEYWGNGCLAVY